MSTPWSFTINTGNPATDQQELARCQASYQAQGMQVFVSPSPSGGFQVTVSQPGAAPGPAQPAGQLGGTMIMNAQAPGAPGGFGAAAPQAPAYGGPPGAVPPGAPAAAAPPGAQPQAYGAPPGAPYGAPQQQAAQPQGAPPGAYAAAAAGAIGAAFGGGPSPQAAPPAQQGYGAPPQQYGAPAAQQSYGASPQQQYGGSPAYNPGAPAYAMAGGGSMAGAASAQGPMAGEGMVNRAAEAVGAPPIASDRLRYLRKVYGLLGAAAFLAVFSGWATTSLGPTVDMVSPEGIPAKVPFLTALFLGSDILMMGAFGVLFLATIGASWVSKVPVVNVAALMGVAVLMGIELAPMVFVAQFYAGFGETMSANPVRDAMIMVLCVFAGITGYVFVTRKDFSWMGSILSMGFFVVLGGCILTFVLGSEPFALAVASLGALLAIGMLLYVTSYIFRNSEMDDAVGDALALLVQLRNLFMFLLRIFMSRR